MRSTRGHFPSICQASKLAERTQVAAELLPKVQHLNSPLLLGLHINAIEMGFRLSRLSRLLFWLIKTLGALHYVSLTDYWTGVCALCRTRVVAQVAALEEMMQHQLSDSADEEEPAMPGVHLDRSSDVTGWFFPFISRVRYRQCMRLVRVDSGIRLSVWGLLLVACQKETISLCRVVKCQSQQLVYSSKLVYQSVFITQAGCQYALIRSSINICQLWYVLITFF